MVPDVDGSGDGVCRHAVCQSWSGRRSGRCGGAARGEGFDGTRVPGDAWRGHPVIIATWASWCPFCALQNPRLQKLYDATRGSDLRILTISIDANPQLAKDYVAKRNFTFR